MTLRGSGNVGIGTDSPSRKFVVSNAGAAGFEFGAGVGAGSGNEVLNYNRSTSLYVPSTSYASTHTFYSGTAGGTRAVDIDSSGNLLVGKTANNDTSTGCVILPTDGNTGRFKATGDGGSGGASFFVTNTSGTATYLVRPNGNVQNTNNSYGAISDVKLKENIVDATPKLADLMQVQVRNYNLIGETTKQIGVVAQELETVFPSMVEESPDEDKDGNRLAITTKSVKYSVFVPMLIKAIQEQQALITTLTDRITALEAPAVTPSTEGTSNGS
jgi:hypothetical protein